MRQVGDRLIPIGITSGRVHTLPTTDGTEDSEGGSPAGATGSRRRRGPRANGQADLSQLLGQMGLGGQDLEEVSLHFFALVHGYSPHASSWSWRPCVSLSLSTKHSKEEKKTGPVARV